MKEVCWPESTGHDAIDALRAIEVAARRCSPHNARQVVLGGFAIAYESGKLAGLRDSVHIECAGLMARDSHGGYADVGLATVYGRIQQIHGLWDEGLPRIVCQLDDRARVKLQGYFIDWGGEPHIATVDNPAAFYVPVGQILSATGN